jgi:hypothetical protein
MPANGPGITSFNLRMGVDEFLYSNLTAGGAQATFGVPPQMSNYRGIITFQCVPVPAGGTLTALTAQLEASLEPEGQDPTAIFGIFNKLVPVSGSPAGVSAYSGISFLNGVLVAFDVSGMGGSGEMRLNFTTFTLNTATGVNVFARIG